MHPCIGTDLHGPKLQAHEPAPPAAHPLLPEKNRAGRNDLYERANNNPNRYQKRGRHENRRNIQNPFPRQDRRNRRPGLRWGMIFLVSSLYHWLTELIQIGNSHILRIITGSSTIGALHGHDSSNIRMILVYMI
jgi:hypothetical protein